MAPNYDGIICFIFSQMFKFRPGYTKTFFSKEIVNSHLAHASPTEPCYKPGYEVDVRWRDQKKTALQV